MIDRRISPAGDGIAYAAQRALETREARALKLYQEHGARIEQVGPDMYFVPSQDGQREHFVRYGEDREECDCGDYVYRGRPCVHLYAAGIRHAKKRRQQRDNFVHAFVVGEE